MPSRDDIVAALRKADAAGDTAAAQRFATMLGAEDPDAETRANAAGIDAGRNNTLLGSSDLAAGVGQAAQQGTFGLSNYINAGARYAGQRLTGVENPDPFNTDLAYARGQSQGEIEGHPVAGTIGGVVGSGLGGGAAGVVLRGARAAATGGEVAAQAPGLVRRLIGGAAAGGGAAGTQAVAQGQDTPTAIQSAAGGAALGGPLAAVAPAVAARLAPASARAWALLADTLKMKPADLAAAVQAHETATGAKPSMAMLANGASQGALRQLATLNPELAAAARTAADQGGAPLHVQLQTLTGSGATRPQTKLAIDAARNDMMTGAMDATHPQTGVALRDEAVPDPTGVLSAPHVDFAMRPNVAVNARLAQASPVMDRIQNGQTTIADIDTVRRALRDQQSNFLRDAPGGLHSKDPAIAKEFGDIATQVEDLGRSTHPDYGAALDRYRDISHYGNGFEHGLAGLEVSHGTDAPTAASLATAPGQAGYNHGQALAVGQRALNTIAPPVAGAQPNAVRTLANTAAAATGGVTAKALHLLGSLTGESVSPRVQQTIASQLFNPATVKQGVANLLRAKVTQRAIADYARTIGGSVGGSIAATLQNAPGAQ